MVRGKSTQVTQITSEAKDMGGRSTEDSGASSILAEHSLLTARGLASTCPQPRGLFLHLLPSVKSTALLPQRRKKDQCQTQGAGGAEGGCSADKRWTGPSSLMVGEEGEPLRESKAGPPRPILLQLSKQGTARQL